MKRFLIMVGLALIILSVPLASGLQKSSLSNKLKDTCYEAGNGCAKNARELSGYDYESRSYFNGKTNTVIFFNSLGLAMLIISINLPAGKIKK